MGSSLALLSNCVTATQLEDQGFSGVETRSPPFNLRNQLLDLKVKFKGSYLVTKQRCTFIPFKKWPFIDQNRSN